MSKLELIQPLYEYNEWANGKVLEAASGLGAEDFSHSRGASFGSIEGTLAHVMAGQVVWLERWMRGANRRSLMELQSLRGFEAIRGALAESHRGLRDFAASLTEERLDEVLAYTDSRGQAHERVLWQLMLHVANHGTQHRSEAAMVLTDMGRSPGEIDYVFFEIGRERE